MTTATCMMKLGLLIGLMTVYSASVQASTEAVKFGVVDMAFAIQASEAGKAAKVLMEKEYNLKKKELQTEEAQIKKLGDEFRKQASVLSEEARAQKQGEIQEKIMRFQEKTAKSQAEIQQKQQQLTGPIVKKMRELIAEISKKKSYTMVLEKSENTVLFSEEKDDLTKEVLELFNKNKI